jgi:uncharacterized protein (DUF58 family)
MLYARQSAVQRAAQLKIKAMKLAAGMKSGAFSSLYRGRGIEFAGVREYFFGDDVRSIDWNVTARMGKPFIKQFQEERELSVLILLDCSRSMSYPARNSLHLACETASLVSLAANFGGCPAGAVVFDGAVLFSRAPMTGTRHTLALLSRFDSLCDARAPLQETAPVRQGTALDTALSGAAKLLKRRALVFVLSDFRTAQWEKPFALLCSKHDVAAVRIAGAFDEEFPVAARLWYTDPETGFTQSLPGGSARFRRKWLASSHARKARWQETVVSRGGYPLALNADTDPFVSLSRFFAARGEA